jgi:hypothetical protein
VKAQFSKQDDITSHKYSKAYQNKRNSGIFHQHEYMMRAEAAGNKNLTPKTRRGAFSTCNFVPGFPVQNKGEINYGYVLDHLKQKLHKSINRGK